MNGFLFGTTLMCGLYFLWLASSFVLLKPSLVCLWFGEPFYTLSDSLSRIFVIPSTFVFLPWSLSMILFLSLTVPPSTFLSVTTITVCWRGWCTEVHKLTTNIFSKFVNLSTSSLPTDVREEMIIPTYDRRTYTQVVNNK